MNLEAPQNCPEAICISTELYLQLSRLSLPVSLGVVLCNNPTQSEYTQNKLAVSCRYNLPLTEDSLFLYKSILAF